MSAAILFPSSIDTVRVIVNNTVDNLLAAQPSYARLPSLYQRAYWLAHETGPLRMEVGLEAPEVSADTPRLNPTPTSGVR